MIYPPALPALRRLQRRFSLVLAGAVCLWMLAVASHFHIDGDGKDALSGAHTFCAVCASVPNSGAAPAVVTFVAAPQRQVFLPSADIIPTLRTPAFAPYYSRGPPLV
jgi:hypothetical protein